MGNKMYNDWCYELKWEVIDLALLFKMIKEELVIMLTTNAWILDDINLCESFSHIKEMIDISDNDLTNFVETIKCLESDSSIFYVADLKDEFEIIKENIYLEVGFITNMVNYMVLSTDFNNGLDVLNESFDEWYDNDKACYNQMKINNDSLKKVRKERKDYFE